MKVQTKRIFNYVKLLNDIKKRSNKNQAQISEELGCTIIHTSNVKNQKSNYSLEKIIKLINSGDYCLDDYVELEGKISVDMEEFDKEKFGDVNQDILKALFQFLDTYIQVGRNEKMQAKKQEYLNESLVKVAGSKIRQLRKEKGIKTDKMAEMLNMKEGSYRNMENGSTGTTLDNYARIARMLGVPVSVIFEDVLEDKRAVLQYELKQMFTELPITELKRYNEMLDEILEIIKKYSE